MPLPFHAGAALGTHGFGAGVLPQHLLQTFEPKSVENGLFPEAAPLASPFSSDSSLFKLFTHPTKFSESYPHKAPSLPHW